MKLQIIIDPSREEETIIYAHKQSELTEKIQKLVLEQNSNILLGYYNQEAVVLDVNDVICFSVENDKTYAKTAKQDYIVKNRLYQIEQKLPYDFVKINQSCIANIKQIAKFDTSFSGTLRITFKNGHTDFVSRRNLKNVKERVGLKK